MNVIEFSLLKRDIVLIIIRDYEIVDARQIIQTQLNVGIEQFFYIIDHLIDRNLLEFNDGNLRLTIFACNILKSRNLDKFYLEDVEKYKFNINENIVLNYIPKKI